MAAIDWTEVSIGIAALLIFVFLVTRLVNQFSKVHERAWTEHREERKEWKNSEIREREKTDAVVKELAEVIRDANQGTKQTVRILSTIQKQLEREDI